MYIIFYTEKSDCANTECWCYTDVCGINGCPDPRCEDAGLCVDNGDIFVMKVRLGTNLGTC